VTIQGGNIKPGRGLNLLQDSTLIRSIMGLTLGAGGHGDSAKSLSSQRECY